MSDKSLAALVLVHASVFASSLANLCICAALYIVYLALVYLNFLILFV